MKNKLIYTFLTLSLFSRQYGCIIHNKKENISIADLKSPDIKKHTLLQESKSVQTIIELPNGTVINEGGILTEDGYILQDTQTGLLDQHRSLKKKNRDLNSENPLFFKGRLAVISSPGSENWYHWLLQVLPRLIILSESGIDYDRIYINNLLYDWQSKSLKIILKFLNISEEKILVINGDCIVQASTLIVPSVPFIPEKNKTMPHWLKEKIRDIFLDEKKNYKEYEKIYVSRNNATIRRIANELELIAVLEKDGFKIIHLEHLSPYEQAYIFNKAKIIVGPHGSGFANLIFSNPQCILIELDHGVNPPRSFYQRFAKIMKCKYFPFYVDQTTEDHLEDDIVVDIPEFLQFFNHISR